MWQNYIFRGRRLHGLSSPKWGGIQPDPEILLQMCYEYPPMAQIYFVTAQIKPNIFTVCVDYGVINKG